MIPPNTECHHCVLTLLQRRRFTMARSLLMLLICAAALTLGAGAAVKAGAAAKAGAAEVEHPDNLAAASEDNNVVDAVQSDHGADAQFQEARHFNQRASAFHDENYENDEDIVYDFSYEVKDPQSGNDFGHRQSRSNGITQGQYRVLMPDGRMQVVDYVSDRDGFRPNVRYEDVGIAVFAGSENHEQFAEGSNQFVENTPPQQQTAGGPPSAQDVAGQGEFQQKRRRRRR